MRRTTIPDNNWNTCDVFNLKERSWSTSEILIKDAHFGSDVGTFANGSLYWLADNKIVALDVNEMVISEIHIPYELLHAKIDSRLGTLHGCLSMMTLTHKNSHSNELYMWVMKTEEQGVKNSWSKSRSFTMDLENIYSVKIINLMDDGRILMRRGDSDKKKELIIYGTSKDSYRVLCGRPSHIDDHINAIEYEESLIFPSII
nr:F-box domain-containing protein [Tanacetum cinerariifolium]